MYQKSLGLLGVFAFAVVLSLIVFAPADAGGACTPQLDKLEPKLIALPDDAAKEKAMEHVKAARKVERNYDEEGCLESLKAALEAIDG